MKIGFTCHPPLDLLAVPIDIFFFFFSIHLIEKPTVSAFSYSRILWLFTNASSHTAVKESFDIHIYCNIEFKFIFILSFMLLKLEILQRKKYRCEHRRKRNHWFELKTVTKETQAVRIISFGLRCVCICDERDGWKEMKVEREDLHMHVSEYLCICVYIYS